MVSVVFRDRRRRGFTLTELSIVLGVIGLILGAIWVAAGYAYNSQKAEKAAQEALTILSNYKQLYGQRGIDTGAGWVDVTCIGINAGYIPPDMIQAGTTCSGNPQVPNIYPQTPWGGNGYVSVSAGQSSNTVLVAFGGLSNAACLQFASAVYSPNSNITYEAIYNGASWTSQWLPPNGNNTSWTTSQINGLCGANSNNAVQVGVIAQ